MIAYYGVALVDVLRITDDHTYLYTLNFQLSAPAAYRQALGAQVSELIRQGFSGEILERFRFRDQYAPNYLLHATLVAGLRQIAPWRPGVDHGVWMYAINACAFAVASVAGIVAAVGTLRRLAPTLMLAALAGLLVIGVLSFLPAIDYRLVERTTMMELALAPVRFGYFLLQPGMQFDLFGPTPRNVAMLFVVAAVFARWLERPAVLYGLLLGAAFNHATYGGMALAIFLGLDLLLTPERLRRWSVVMPAMGAAVWFFAFGLNLSTFAGPAILLVPALLFAVIVAAATPFGSAIVGRLPLVGRVRALPPRLAEAVVLAAGAVLVFLAAVALVFAMKGETQTYIAAELTGRPLAIIRLPLIFCVSAFALPLVLERLGDRFAGALPAGAAVLAVAFIARAVLAYAPPPTTAELEAHRETPPAEIGLNISLKEMAAYSAAARMLDAGPGEATP